MVVSPAGLPRVGRGAALGRLVSPGSMAGALWARTGLTAPLAKFARPDDRCVGRWIEAAHGGWVSAELTGGLLPVVDADGRSAYPAAFSLARWWTVLRAESVAETDARAEVGRLCRRAGAGDLGVVLERANYPTLGRTICAVRPAGEPWPTERPVAGGARFCVAPVEGDPLYVTAADAVAASYLARRAPRVTWACRLDPVGTVATRLVRLRDEAIVPAGEDPIAALVRLRPGPGGDERLRAVVRAVANAAAWGIFARLDPVRVDGRLTERPATWTWPPVAAGVPSVVRLWVAAIERVLADKGGSVVARDTDGIAVVSLPKGGTVVLPDGRHIDALAWSEIEEVLSSFDQLGPFGDGAAFWDIERGGDDRPLHLVALAQKRYIKAQANGRGTWDVVDGTEHALGGGLVDPPGLAGRAPDRRHRWTLPVAAHALAVATSADSPAFEAPWERAGHDPFPALHRWSAGSPAALARVPGALGAHAFAPLLEARVDRLLGPDVPAPLALDPGDDLADWAELHWVNQHGQRVTVSTGEDPGASTPLARLADVAANWCVPVPSKEPGPLIFDRRLARRVGRGGALVDARLADADATADEHQALYTEGDAASFVVEMAATMGKRAFARRFGLPLKTAERIALGRRPSRRTVQRVVRALGHGDAVVRCALEGCDAPVTRPNARYCTKAHTDRAYRARKAQAGRRPKSERTPAPDPYADIPTCESCGALVLGGADGGAGLCVDCRDEGML